MYKQMQQIQMASKRNNFSQKKIKKSSFTEMMKHLSKKVSV